MQIFMNIVPTVGLICTCTEKTKFLNLGSLCMGATRKRIFSEKPEIQFCWVHCAYSMCKVWWKNIQRIRSKMGTPQKIIFSEIFFPIQKAHRFEPLLQIFRDIVKIAWEKSLLENFQKLVNLYGEYQKTNFHGYVLYTIF